MERRNFFAAIFTAAEIRDTRVRGSKRPKYNDTRLYRGPMVIPPDVAEAVREDPALHRTRHAGKLVSRYCDGEGTVWLFRCPVPETRMMVGEVVKTPDGRKRVHCWACAISASTYPQARILNGSSQPPAAVTEDIDISQYLDPQYSQKLVAEMLSDERKI